MMSIRVDITKRENNIVVSTVEPKALAWFGEYETAISFDDGVSWRIAEGYDTLEEAIKGHKKYSNMDIKELENIEFID